ncbi:MAG: hypothetical protein BRC26_04340 [Nanohaloarchaea archaeon QH_8_44_6]|nr:MAG: hypothetical protein BRC26_04340 [Nanohaloarchaea archaeon QH_8_44_6]
MVLVPLSLWDTEVKGARYALDGTRPEGQVLLARWNLPPTLYKNFRYVNPTIKTRHKGKNTTMNANTRNFETELQAQSEEDRREETEVSAKANLVTATAL